MNWHKVFLMTEKICPRCGSDNIEWIIPQNWSMWSCNNCDYTGAIIEGDAELKKQIEKRWNTYKNEILRKEKLEYLKETEGLSKEQEKELKELDELLD